MQQNMQKIRRRAEGKQKFPQTPLTNLQLEILKLYSVKLSEEELVEIKQLLVRYLAHRMTSRVDQIWEEQGLTEADMERWVNDEQQ
ncbi:MAG: hypothetical protein AB1797_03165 [bacterium]